MDKSTKTKTIRVLLLPLSFVAGWCSNLMFSFGATGKPTAYGLVASLAYLLYWIYILAIRSRQLSPFEIKCCLFFWCLHLLAPIVYLLDAVHPFFSNLAGFCALLFYTPMVGLAGILPFPILNAMVAFSFIMASLFLLRLTRGRGRG